MEKINRKIVVAIILSSLIITLVVGGVIGAKSYSSMRESSEEKLQKIVENSTNDYNKMIYSAEGAAKIISSMIGNGLQIDKAKNNKVYMSEYIKGVGSGIKNVAEKNKELKSIFVAFDPKIAGHMYQSWYVDKEGNGNYVSQAEIGNEYYKEFKNDNGIWYSPYYDDNSRMNLMSYMVPVYSNGKVVAMAETDISFDELKRIINNIKVYDKGYAFLLDDKYNVLVHKDYKKGIKLSSIGDKKQIAGIINDMKKSKSGVGYYKVKGIKKVISYSKLKNGYTMCVEVDQNDIFKSLNRLMIFILVIIIICLVTTSMSALYLGKKISEPIVYATECMNTISDLDLNYDEKFDVKSIKVYETFMMLTSLTKLRNKLKETVNDLKGSSCKISSYSENVDKSSNDMRSSLRIVSETVDELAKAAGEQSGDIQGSLKYLTDLGDEINVLVETSNRLDKYASKAQDVNKSGIVASKKLINKFKETNELEDKTASSVEVLSNKSKSIGEIINVINNIANQTNLLALNAAIEAARAGEAGKGFAVVAAEIGKLSKQTSDATSEIGDIIKEIQSEINQTKNNMDESTLSMKEANEALLDSDESFKVIEGVVVEIVEKIQQFIEKVHAVNDDKDEVLNSLQTISAISEEFAASTEEISSTVEEQLESMNSLANGAKELNSTSDQLDNIIQLFKVK